jgi:signal transduction histidine kinase
MDLASIRGMLAGDPDARKAAVRKIEAASQVADGMIHTVRRISSELRPGMLDDLGLLPSVEWLAQDFSQRTGISVRIASEIGSVDLDRSQSTAIFRVLQETLTNVARHSKATEVSGRVRTSDAAFELEIRDNGQGFSSSLLHEASSLGLIGMRERAGSVGGSIEFVSEPGDGTTVRLRVPLRGKQPS